MIDERGTMAPMLGGLLFAALALVGLATDIALLHGSYLEVATVAEGAAEAGAGMIAIDALHRGTVEVDVDAAGRVVEEFVAANDPEARARLDATVSEVCVEVVTSRRTFALSFVGVTEVRVAASACASPAVG